MISLSKNQIIKLHEDLIKEFGRSLWIRDENLLNLSINSPFQSFAGKDLYKGPIRKIVHLGFSIIKTHPFVDENKRIGTHLILLL